MSRHTSARWLMPFSLNSGFSFAMGPGYVPAMPAAVERQFVSSESPTMPRAGAGGRPCQGVYHHPAGARPSVALIATHYEVDFSEHYLAEHAAARGVGFLGWNTRYRGNGGYFLLDNAVTDIGVGVRWLREQ